MELFVEDVDDLLGLAFAKEAVVYVNTDELLAYCLNEEGSNDGGIYPTGKG